MNETYWPFCEVSIFAVQGRLAPYCEYATVRCIIAVSSATLKTLRPDRAAGTGSRQHQVDNRYNDAGDNHPNTPRGRSSRKKRP